MLGKGHGGLYQAPTIEEERERLGGERDQIKFIDLRWAQLLPLVEQWSPKLRHFILIVHCCAVGLLAGPLCVGVCGVHENVAALSFIECVKHFRWSGIQYKNQY